MGGRRQQLRIAGTEPEVIEDLVVAANAYRQLMLDRVDFGRREKEAKVALEGVIEKLVVEGRIKLPPGAEKGEVVTIYRYEGEDGEPLEVKYGRKQQVRVRQAKAGGDDEPEAVE